MIKDVRKRDGTLVLFNREKITSAIFKAAQSVGGKDRGEAEKLADDVVKLLEKQDKAPTVEEIQDTVERVLIENGHAKTAKAYILYRQRRAEIRAEKRKTLEKESLNEVDKAFDVNALRVLKSRYLRKSEEGRLIETPKELFTRVAVHTGIANMFYDEKVFDKNARQEIHESEELNEEEYEGKLSIGKYALNVHHINAVKRLYTRLNDGKQMKVSLREFIAMLGNGSFDAYEKGIDDFYNLMVLKRFMPNTPAIANFGTHLGMGSACFALGIDDSMESIMETLKSTAIIHKSGGGTGFNFSTIRPEGDYVSTTSGVASGPISFMRLFDTMTEVVKQGGIRRGANMGILNVNHPDVEKFIKAKEGNKALRNFNISVLIMPDFWHYYETGKPYPLVNPRNSKVIKYTDPKVLLDTIVYQAWESAEPGVIFYDTVNKYNPFFKHLGPIVTTNPCVSSDSLVSTENGLERVDSIKAGNIVADTRTYEAGTTLQYGTELVKPLQVVKTGYKECYKVETESGYELTATPDHKILTTTGWKPVGELAADDFVLIQSGEGKFNTNAMLPVKIENSVTGRNGRKYEFNLPTEWSRELGLLLGWMTGDGWLNARYCQTGLVFAKEDEEAKKVIKPILEKYCNRSISEVTYPNGCVQIRSASRHIVDFFKELGVTEADKEREIPSSLFTATEEAVLGFLEGLFSSDGSIGMAKESRNYIRLNSSSIKLLKQVQLLLLNLGIKSAIYDRSTKSKNFRYVNKKGEIIKYKTSGTNFELNISKENLARFIEKISFVQSKNKEKTETLKSFGFYKERFAEKIKSVEYAGTKEVWDITEPKTHSFIANGIVVHNCGEVLLYPNEPCNLGSINVWAFAKENESGEMYMDWDALKETIMQSTKFLDCVIDVNNYPLKAIEEMSLATRKIGLGLMGLADLMYELRIPYSSKEGVSFMEQIMEFINYWSKVESIKLAEERGPMPYYSKSFYPEGRLPIKGFDDRDCWHFDWTRIAEDAKTKGIRNGFTTVVAPTGSISMISGCSSGMEPVYSLAYEKHVAVGSFYYVEPVFERIMQKEGLYDEELIKDVCTNNGSVQGIGYIPRELKKVFITAMDIKPEDHIRALAAIQKWTDSSVSKTNNFPANATVDDMKKSYLLAYELGCKDVTVFRDTSIKEQVLRVADKKRQAPEQIVEVSRSAAGMLSISQPEREELRFCPQCKMKLIKKEGCLECMDCGWGMCSSD